VGDVEEDVGGEDLEDEEGVADVEEGLDGLLVEEIGMEEEEREKPRSMSTFPQTRPDWSSGKAVTLFKE